MIIRSGFSFNCAASFQVKRRLSSACTLRAQTHVVGGPREIVDPEFSKTRRDILEEYLSAMDIDAEEMLSDPDLVGSSALKAFQTFISPRKSKIEHAYQEALNPAAQRTANQIGFLVRQRKAELATYLRNKDRARDAREASGMSLQPLVLVLDNVRSAYNVGSILRTAETAGCQEVVCCGFTPTPPHDKVSKTAFDSAETVPTRHFQSTLAAIEALKLDGFTVYGMETTSKSSSYVRVSYPAKTALVLGNEVTVVDTVVMSKCDELIEIPTFGMKNSLNVASAAPVVIFEVLRQWGVSN